MVASVLHFQKIASAVASRTRWAKLVYILERGHLHAGLVVMHPALHIVGNIEFLVAAKHYVHALYLRYLLSLKLSIASGHHHERIGIFAHKAAYELAALLIGFFSHTAGVDHTYVGHLAGMCSAHSFLGKELAYSARFGKVEFAAQCVILGCICGKCGVIYHLLCFEKNQLQRY